MEFQHQGRTYTIVPQGATDRDLTITEILALLPDALDLIMKIKQEVAAIKKGKKPAIAIALIVQQVIVLVSKVIDKVDIADLNNYEKAEAYANGIIALILQNEE